MHKQFSSLTFVIVGLAKTSQVAEPRLKGWRKKSTFCGSSGCIQGFVDKLGTIVKTIYHTSHCISHLVLKLVI